MLNVTATEFQQYLSCQIKRSEYKYQYHYRDARLAQAFARKAYRSLRSTPTLVGIEGKNHFIFVFAKSVNNAKQCLDLLEKRKVVVNQSISSRGGEMSLLTQSWVNKQK